MNYPAEGLEPLYGATRHEYTKCKDANWYYLRWLGLGVPKNEWSNTANFSFEGMQAGKSWRELIVRHLFSGSRRQEFLRRRQQDQGREALYISRSSCYRKITRYDAVPESLGALLVRRKKVFVYLWRRFWKTDRILVGSSEIQAAGPSAP